MLPLGTTDTVSIAQTTRFAVRNLVEFMETGINEGMRSTTKLVSNLSSALTVSSSLC